MRECPCKMCKTDRHTGCHVHCRNYLSWRTENLAFLESVHRQKEAEYAGFNERKYYRNLIGMQKRKYGCRG